MATIFLDLASVRDEIDHCLRREREERSAYQRAHDISARDAHATMAERYANRAHDLAEQLDSPAIADGLWETSGGGPAGSKPSAVAKADLDSRMPVDPKLESPFGRALPC